MLTLVLETACYKNTLAIDLIEIKLLIMNITTSPDKKLSFYLGLLYVRLP